MNKKLPLALVFLFLFAACLQGARAPQVAPQRTLSLDVELGDARPKSEFGVIFAGPKGQTNETGEVTIVFNRPMRPLELAGDESAPPAEIRKVDKTVPKGSWKWLGTSALMFSPEPALARATDYTVTVPAGTKALDGSALAAPYTFSFQTARPRIARVEPRDSSHLTPTQAFTVYFNQPVDPKEVERSAKVLVGPSADKLAPVAFAARWPDRETTTKVEIKPSAPLALASAVHLAFDGLRGIEGPLPLSDKYVAKMETYGPLSVTNADCSRGGPNRKCTARGSVYLSLSNRVAVKDLRTHVRVEGAPPLDWGTRPLGDEERTFGSTGDAWGVLDVGRGRWPYRNIWNWGGGAGHATEIEHGSDHVVGLQFGGKWTEGTGHTENGIIVDGRLTKVGDELEWTYDWDAPLRPWTLRAPDGSIDVTLHPRYDRHSRVEAVVLGMEVHQVFGHWSGTVRDDDGVTYRFDGMQGFAEEARNRW